ncbi:MAG TPA: trypsin-like peptidase domain-containing protein [Candidatus Hydrogenedentes bacterium]|nr:trypsin-like peptidase domain-containing protein [Candidatus Hydrogenedentota bacterium]HQB02567.1 trypsin-like peptidase domain-containing protein [Candidatus Hydrogenedentota bacterium]
MIKRTAVFFLGLAILAGTGYVQEAELSASGKATVTEIGNVPWVPTAEPKVVYGDDDRMDVFQEGDRQKLEWAASTCALVYTTRMTIYADGSADISAPAQYIRSGLPACPDEPFGSQPTASYCTGFMVGDDLIVTAGHCYSSSYFDATRFVFGYDMLDETTPRLNFEANRVYKGVEVVSYSGSGSRDHCVVRVDRRITAPGAKPFPIRRTGTLRVSEPLGIIGHPAGLPKKLAFGNTYVRSIDNPEYFIANVDAFSGNSGSPVINAVTGYIEGILVRGDTDFIYDEVCFRSNKVPNNGGRGEEVTRTLIFADSVPDIENYPGSIRLDARIYKCDAEVTVSVVDKDLRGLPTASVDLEVLSGDREVVVIRPVAGEEDRFTGTIPLRAGEAEADSGFLEVSHGDMIIARYLDETNNEGQTVILETQAAVDCIAPIIQDVSVAYVGSTQARVQFTTDEPSLGIINYGLSCDKLNLQAIGNPAQTVHTVTLSGLSSAKKYYFSIEVLDEASNASYSDNDGTCHSFQTVALIKTLAEYFNTQNLVDVEYGQATFVPVNTADYYMLCYEDVADFAVAPAGDPLILGDDTFVEIAMDPGQGITFYGTVYDRFFVGSNGYITFGQGDTNFQALPSQHFLLPRISGFMADLCPHLRGAVRLNRLSDRYCVSYEDVPVYESGGGYPPENSHTFQIELFFNGIIRLTWKDLFAARAMTGLSPGAGAPPVFTSIKMKNAQGCQELTFAGKPHSADVNGDWQISPEEMQPVIRYYQQGYHCDSSTADGYAPGAGDATCPPHDSDYLEQDWQISLSELLRLVQLHNAGGYMPDPLSEDGYAPLP